MMLSTAQILAVAANAGFTGNDLSTAAAIALAESGGDETAYNPETAARSGTPQGQGSYGLWQIYLKQHPQFDPSQLLNPQYNASAAYSIYVARGNSFVDWTSYTHGVYLGFVPQVLASIGSPAVPVDLTGQDVSGDASTSGNGGIASMLFSPTMLLVEGIGLLLWLYLRG